MLKNTGMICYMVTAVISLIERYVEKYRKLIKLVNIDEENLHLF